jgi:uncharacterized protein YaiI (UPF0178 family)
LAKFSRGVSPDGLNNARPGWGFAYRPGCIYLLQTNTNVAETMKLWIDADAAPRDVKEIVFRAAKRLEMQTVLVANQRLPVPPGNAFVSAVRVEGGPDVADRYIADNADPGDVAVTADIPLAAALVEKRVLVIDPRGEEYTPDNVAERLSVRDFMDGLRGSGVETGGARPYGDRDKQAFANSLDRVLTRAMRAR